MSLQQCAHCLYRDRLLKQGDDTYCQVHEERVPRADDCSDYEPDDDSEADDRWNTGVPVGDD